MTVPSGPNPFHRRRPAAWTLGLAAAAGIFFLSGRSWTLASDTIYFKDGMRTICEGSAREDGEDVHCNYDGGLLIYPKSDVAHIEKGRSSAAPAESKPPGAAPGPLAADPEPPRPGAVPPETAAAAPGIAFYDPRRPQKYWSSETRHHDTLGAAIAALADEFKRPPSWIEDNLGDSNDLGEVRATLAARLQGPSAAQAPVASARGAAVEFYNPRRTPRYMTGPNAPHGSFQEALEALARDFNRPTDWVERHMGPANDVDQIRQSLRDAQASETKR
jgi:hypothetical protein